MDLEPLPSPERFGGWISNYRVRKSEALKSIEEAKNKWELFDAVYEKNFAEVEDGPYARHLSEKEQNDATNATISALLFSCLFIEATINYFGTVTLGEDFFRKHIEKSSILSKLCIVIAISSQQLLQTDAPVYKLLEKIFSIRNQIVHCKTREYDAVHPEKHFPEDLAPENILKLSSLAISEFMSLMHLVKGDHTLLKAHLSFEDS